MLKKEEEEPVIFVEYALMLTTSCLLLSIHSLLEYVVVEMQGCALCVIIGMTCAMGIYRWLDQLLSSYTWLDTEWVHEHSPESKLPNGDLIRVYDLCRLRFHHPPNLIAVSD